MAARAFAQSYVDDLVPSVFELLTAQGFFFDASERGLLTKTVRYRYRYRFGIGVVYSPSHLGANVYSLMTRPASDLLQI